MNILRHSLSSVNFLRTIIVLGLFAGNIAAQKPGISDILKDKENIRILVTDSGLGGYSVAAGIDSVLTANKNYKNAEIVFCNALPSANFRYNELPDAQSKADIFSSVLSRMNTMFKPDIILIACNTLSVVYPLTGFAKNENVPVIGIVEIGAKVITDSLKANTNARVIILGTETTIQSAVHTNLLEQNNIQGKRVQTQSCPNLESEIQVDPKSDMVANLIEFYLDEITVQPENAVGQKTFVALCCTHYGFARPVFQQKLNSIFSRPVIINPNDEMIKMFDFPRTYALEENTVKITVYSQASLSDEEKDGIGKIILPISPRAEKALEMYTKLNGIF